MAVAAAAETVVAALLPPPSARAGRPGASPAAGRLVRRGWVMARAPVGGRPRGRPWGGLSLGQSVIGSVSQSVSGLAVFRGRSLHQSVIRSVGQLSCSLPWSILAPVGHSVLQSSVVDFCISRSVLLRQSCCWGSIGRGGLWAAGTRVVGAASVVVVFWAAGTRAVGQHRQNLDCRHSYGRGLRASPFGC